MSFDESLFPRLSDGYQVTSPPSRQYNCIAWAAGVNDEWWDPSADGKWPAGLARNDAIGTLVSLYEGLGFTPCDQAAFEPGHEKIAIYGDDGIWAHAARQLPGGRWTSKLGSADDIEHATLGALESEDYGHVLVILKRSVAASTS